MEFVDEGGLPLVQVIEELPDCTAMDAATPSRKRKRPGPHIPHFIEGKVHRQQKYRKTCEVLLNKVS